MAGKKELKDSQLKAVNGGEFTFTPKYQDDPAYPFIVPHYVTCTQCSTTFDSNTVESTLEEDTTSLQGTGVMLFMCPTCKVFTNCRGAN